MTRPHRRSIYQLAILLAITNAGCGSSCGSKKSRDKVQPKTTTTAKTAAPKATVKSNRQAAFDGLVDGVITTCKWLDGKGFRPRCRKLKQFFQNEIAMEDASLVPLLKDSNKHKRWLGAAALRRTRGYRGDTMLATRMVTAMEAETNKPVAMGLADALSRIQLKKTQLIERVKKIILGHHVLEARQRLLKHAMFYNQVLLYDFVVALARKATPPAMRHAAIVALFTGTPKGRYAETCTLWSKLLDDPDRNLGALGSAFLTRFSQGLCTQYYDSVLAVIAKRARTGTVKAEQLSDSLRNLYRQAGATEKQKKRAVAIALVLLKNSKNYGPARARALELLYRGHSRGKQLVKAHLKDKDGFVMRRAERLNRTR